MTRYQIRRLEYQQHRSRALGSYTGDLGQRVTKNRITSVEPNQTRRWRKIRRRRIDTSLPAEATDNTTGQKPNPIAETSATDTQTSDVITEILSDSEFLSKLTRLQEASEALELIRLSVQAQSRLAEVVELTPSHVRELFDRCLKRNNVDLCLSIYQQMTLNLSLSGSNDQCLVWPPVTIEIANTLLLALAKRMKVNDALNIIQWLSTSTGVDTDAQEIVFGKVINSPIPPFTPLTVVQPQEGLKTVACASSKYLFEIFSGEVTAIESDARDSGGDGLVTLARFLKLWKKPDIRAIHEMVVTSPSGMSRSFRFATETADVPAKQLDRVSVVCAPNNNQEKRFGVFAPIPPSVRHGEALSLCNHDTSKITPLIRAPNRNTTETIPSWILPTALILAGSDAASSIVDPNFPLIGAVSIAAIGTAISVGSSVLLPRLKQLPDEKLRAESARQELLRQHQILVSKIDDLARDASNDVRSLAKLWQLESKMTAVDASGKYDARIQRIEKARQSLENRLVCRIELVDGYRRVANMIEIEVEMDVDVPQAEVEGIEQQLTKLEEVEKLQQEIEYQAAAQDELERLLRASD